MNNQWIPVLVRLEDYENVTRLVADWEASRPSQTTDLGVDVAVRPVPGVDSGELDELSSRPLWSVEDLSRLAAGTTDTTERWTRAMDLCAEHPGTYFPTSVVASRTGMSVAQWRDAPRKISRHLKKHYPDVPRTQDGDPTWPLHAKTRPENPDEVSWAMSSEMASLWRQVRGTD